MKFVKVGYCQTSRSHSVQREMCISFLEKLTLRWSCSFSYQEEPPSLPFTPLELSCFKIYFNRSFWLPFFCSGTSKSSILKAQAKLSVLIKVSIPSTSFSKFSTIVVVDVFKAPLWPPV